MQYCLKTCLCMAFFLLPPLSGPLAESPGPASGPVASSPQAETETDQSAGEAQERRTGFAAVWRTAAPRA